MTQAVLYLGALAAPSLIPPTDDAAIDYGFRATVRIDGLDGRRVAEDVLTIDQRLSLVEGADEDGLTEEEQDHELTTAHPGRSHDPATFQVLVDAVALGPSGNSGLEGSVSGRLLDLGSVVARFDVAVERPGGSFESGLIS